MSRSGYSAREKCPLPPVRKTRQKEPSREHGAERIILFSGARSHQARINCRVIYCATDLLGKFSTEVRVTEKPDCPVKAIKFLYGAVGGRVRIVSLCVSGRKVGRYVLLRVYFDGHETKMYPPPPLPRLEVAAKKRNKSSQCRGYSFGGLNLFERRETNISVNDNR